METIETVIGGRAQQFVRLFVSQFGFSVEHAEAFVTLAGNDLLESYRWRADHLAAAELSAPENVREILGVIGGNQIADTLGIPRTAAWSGLRVFVPRVLQLADGHYGREASA